MEESDEGAIGDERFTRFHSIINVLCSGSVSVWIICRLFRFSHVISVKRILCRVRSKRGEHLVGGAGLYVYSADI